MPSNATPKAPKTASTDFKQLALDRSYDALCMAEFGQSAVGDLMAILNAITKLGQSELASGSDVISRLAKVGAQLADTHYQTLDDTVVEMRKKVTAIEELRHA
ncbi:hypothetical protein QN372_00960 [Undibacterium sp. RTI2.1]|uniref:hypothetical protein n=1 Tax=unclassified Undibacterium TaxID=2630295 RepID=UPI002AB42258|nr:MULTISPECIES: hypothetical protein [unclassified Undibacterium]MDY7537708.1 hypothetical protein [Undibacterium sp. 5I1]MEB0029309.1 hypothetical protein [Undibacterium sp. RTI2.1]MEB0115617.1 hypothetical protein [Undibacterium sp. RTI2.2]MEB0230200.1 hypothetical protein [Undibacterium sp. 10I3]MEB0256445.1 hypothetical protein [Undibacterium sp. 5I1]